MRSEDHVRAAWNALLRGDLEERDRQCELGLTAIEREMLEGDTDFFVDSSGTCIPLERPLKPV